jgi:hypothetical protein
MSIAASAASGDDGSDGVHSSQCATAMFVILVRVLKMSCKSVLHFDETRVVKRMLGRTKA